MKNFSEGVIKALSGVLPEDTVKTITETVQASFDEALSEIKSEYETKLEEAYADLESAKELSEQEAEQGYAQAYDLICEYKDRLTLQREELERQRDEGFQEAFEMLQEERNKNDELESAIYEEYEQKYADLKKWFVKKLDKFLPTQRDKYYESARKDLLNDPVFSEHRLAFNKILEASAEVLSDEDFAKAFKSKDDNLTNENEDLKKRLRILEGRNTRLATENNQLQESVRAIKTNINESTREERRVRIERAKKAESRGVIVEDKRIIGEYEEPAKSKPSAEDYALQELNQSWGRLAGVEDDNN